MDRPKLRPVDTPPEPVADPVAIAAAWGLDFAADCEELTPDTIRFFSGGQCHALAAACGDYLGLDGKRVRIIGTMNDKYRLHMGVAIDNQVADARGMHQLEDWCAHWDSGEIVYFDDADDAVIWALSKCAGQSADEVAELYAPIVISHWAIEAHNQDLPGYDLMG